MSRANSFGEHFTCTSFGESHGPALGVVIEGCPAGVPFREDWLARALERRRPGGKLVSARQEEDRPEILSGVYEGKTLGTPIAVMVRNVDARSEDYKNLAPRPGHADDVWLDKFGHTDPRGGGRSSGRETLARVIAGAFAQMFVATQYEDLTVKGFARSIGPFELSADELRDVGDADAAPARFPSRARAAEIEKLLLDAKQEGRSYGGVAEIWIDNAPRGLGQPVFRKLKSELACAYLSVGATIGVELGEGFASTQAEGSEFHQRDSAPYGGVRGGISTGERIAARVAFKPTSSVLDVAKKGRHDPCIVPRAIPVLEAMTWMVLADQILWSRLDRA